MYIFFWFNGFMGMWRKKGVQNIIRFKCKFFLVLLYSTLCLLNWGLNMGIVYLGSIVGILREM